MKANQIGVTVGGLFLSCLASFAGNSDVETSLAPTPPEKAWDFTLIPYLWAAGLQGETGQQPLVSDVDLGFGDLLENLDFAMSASLAGTHKSGWGFLFDAQWIELSGGTGTPGSGFSSVDADITSAFGTLAPTYRLIDSEQGHLTAYAGARVTYSDTDITLNGGVAPLPASLHTSIDDTWIDGVIGLHYQWFFAEKWFLAGLVDVGAGDSDLNWQALVGLGYQFNDRWSAHLAYRYMAVDYENDGFVYDIETQGIALGIGIRW